MIKKESTKEIILAAAISIIVLSGIFWIAWPGPQDQEPPDSASQGTSVLAAEEKSFDFGTVSMAAGNVSHTFKIRNPSAEPVQIKKLYTSCMCTTATLDIGGKKFGPFGMIGHGFIPKINAVISAGEEAEIEVVFDPTAHGPAGVGRIERIVYIEQAGQKPLELAIKAVVTP